MYRTLEQRKREQAERRAGAPALLRASLSAFAAERGGRYLIFGSLAKGEARYDSDIDILLDFPAGFEAEAWRRAEDACAQLRIEADIAPLHWFEGAFLERALAKVISIP